MPVDLGRWLPEFPVRDHCLYLDHAAVAPLPRRVAEAMRARIVEQETGGARSWHKWRETQMSVRSMAAELTGCAPADVSIIRSTSEGLSVIAQGLTWRKGDAVLVGEQEFAGNVAPWLTLTRRGVAVRRYPNHHGRVRLEDVGPLLKPPVRLLALSWVAFHTGWVAPVVELAELARAQGILLVLDAIQGLGALADRFPTLGADALVAGAHKWLLGPEGVGLLVTRPELRARLHPPLAGWCNVKLRDRDLFLRELDLFEDGRRFEPGSLPDILVAGLGASLDLLLEVGPEEVQARVVHHARTLTHLLLEAGWQVGSPGAAHPVAGIVSARHPHLPAEEVARRMRERQIEVAARQGWVRFSPHFYATTGELEALKVILGKL